MSYKQRPTITRKQLIAFMRAHDACMDASEWVEKSTTSPHDLWLTCERGDWMLWLAGYAEIDRKLLVLAACDVAAPALTHVPKGEDRPRIAIETARSWCKGEATIEEVRKAAHAAYTAHAAHAAYAAYAAYTAHGAYAAYAAEAKSLKHSADLVRKRIPWTVIANAIKAAQ